MMNEFRKQAEAQASICSVFSNARRVMILWILLDREMSVGDIAGSVGATLQNTSQHLRLMKDKGVLTSRREGHTIYYRIAENELMKDCLLVRNAHRIQTMFEERSTVA